MAKNIAKKEDYPKVKYRVINGNGYSLVNTWDEVLKKVEYYKTNPNFKNEERFQVKHVIKVTEEFVEI